MAKLTKAFKDNQAKTIAAAKSKVAAVKSQVIADQTEVKPGRPRGSRTRTEQVETTASRCPKCESTKRLPYAHTRVVEAAGVSNGLPHTHVVFRYTRCGNCGQARIDRTCENRT